MILHQFKARGFGACKHHARPWSDEDENWIQHRHEWGKGKASSGKRKADTSQLRRSPIGLGL